MGSQFTGASTGVLGLGKSDIVAAEVLMSLGVRVTRYDAFRVALKRARQALDTSGVAFYSLVGEKNQT